MDKFKIFVKKYGFNSPQIKHFYLLERCCKFEDANSFIDESIYEYLVNNDRKIKLGEILNG